MAFTLAPPVFTILRALVEERVGLHYADDDIELFATKLAGRALDAGFTSALDYYYFLRYDDAERREFDALVDALVVNETYFFREVDQIRVLCDGVLLPAIGRGERPRVWCAATSTGEEPLSIAMLLAARGCLAKVDLVATDISSRALARAKEGIYGTRAMRVVDDATRERWFTRKGDQFVISRELTSAITWGRTNLFDEAAITRLGMFDAILCRNVLIYFSENNVRCVTALLANRLQRGGKLLVGASESLLRFGTMLHCEERAGTFFYRRADE